MTYSVMPLLLSPQTKVVLVGNGPSLLGAHNGQAIDCHDEIVRFNRFRLRGFEAHTGTRTTLWSTFGHGYLPGDDDVRPERMIFVYGERGEPAYEPKEIYRIPRAFYNQQWQRLRDKANRPPEARQCSISSGFVVAMWLLHVVGLERVTLAGFDHFRKDFSNQHHYYNPRGYGRPPEMDGDAEAALLSEEGERIIRL